MQKIRRRKIGEILIAEGLVTQQQLSDALETQLTTRQPVAEILLKQGFVIENDIVRAICIQNQLPFIRPKDYQVSTGLFDAFGPEFLFRYRVVPLDKIGPCFIVAVGDIPTDAVTKRIQETLGGEIHFYFASASDVEDVIKEHFGLSQEEIIAFTTGKGVDDPAAAQKKAEADHSSLLATLDDSWESIFEESERNVAAE